MAKKRATKKADKTAEPRDRAEIALELEKTLAQAKALYARLDDLTGELLQTGARHGTRIVVNEKTGRTLKLVDQWRGKLKVFTSAAFPKWKLERADK